MEKDLGRISKGMDTEIVVRLDDFGGKVGLTIREFVKSERYTGFTKAGTRIPADKLEEFKAMINSIDQADLQALQEEAAASAPAKKAPAKKAPVKKKEETKDNDNQYAHMDDISEEEI